MGEGDNGNGFPGNPDTFRSGGSTESASALESTVFDPSSGQWGVLRRYSVAPWLVLITQDGTRIPTAGRFFVSESGFALEVDRQGNVQRQRVLRESELSSLFGGGTSGGGGGGGGGIGLAGQQALQEQRFEFQQKLQKQAEENAQRRDLIAAATSLSERRAADVAEARRLTVSLIGNDPLRAALAMQGQAQIGVTPTSAFGRQLEEFINTPTAGVNPFAPTPQLNTQVSALRQQVAGGVPEPAFGLAHGGVIDMERTSTGAFEPDLDPSTGAILVGEGVHGEGLRAGTAEVIIPERDGRFRVVPLRRSAALGDTFTPASLAAAFSPVFSHLGFEGTPFIGRTAFGGPARHTTSAGNLSNLAFGPVGIGENFGDPFPTVQRGRSAETFSALGIRPQYARLPNGVILFLKDGVATPLGVNERDSIRALQRFQIQPSEVVNLQLPEIAQLGFRMTNMPLASLPTVRGEEAQGQPFATPLVEPNTGMLLPDPRLIASLLRPNALPPAIQDLIRSTIDLALDRPGATQERADAFTPFGTAFQGQQTAFA